jgi:hypothetical protein
MIHPPHRSFFSRSCVARFVLRKKRRVHRGRGRHYGTIYTMRSDLITRLAQHQSSHQSNTEATTTVTDPTWFLKTRELRSSQMLQMIKATSESKALRRGFATLFRKRSHHEVKWSAADGVRRCHPLRRRHLNQSSRLNGQPRKRWLMAFTHWEHKAQGP